MPDKKKKRKSDKGENEKKDKENDDWKELLTRAKLSDIPCTCLVSILSESNQEQNTYINILCDGSHLSLRRSMKILSKMEMIKNIFQAEIFRASSRTPKYFQVCEEALNIVKGGSKISTELWILLIKFHILYFIEEYILQKEREELKTYTDSNSQPNETISEVKELGKHEKKNTAVKTKVSSLKLKSLLKEADGNPVQQKLHSKIRHKNEEWKDIPIIDDAPPDGPDIYFILVDFHDTDILEGLAEAEKKSKIDYSKKQTVLRKPMNKSDKKQKNKIHEVEELTFEEQELAINTFWEIVENRKENTRRKFSFDDLPIVPFKLPELPLDEQMYSEIGRTIYNRLSFLIYDIYCLKMKYLNYLQKIKIRLKNSNDYAICTEEINIYNSLMDKIPAEAVTVPLILTCMLEGVVNGGEKISMNSSSFYLTHGHPIQLMKTVLPEIDMKYGTTNKPKERAKLNFPKIINFGDELLMKMYQYLDCTVDAVCVPYNLLRQNPISIMWNRYPSLPNCEKIFYAHHLRKFTESIENEIFDYNVVFYLFCLLKFEEMLKEISKMNLKMKEGPSFPISTILPPYVIVTNDQSIFLTLKQMDNLVSLSKAVGCKVIDLNGIQNENMPRENYSKQFCLRKRNVKITLSDKDCVGIFKALKANTDMSVESKGNEKSFRKDSIGERNSNATLSEEKINFSTEFTVETLSESQPFHCNEIEDLFSNKDSSNLFKITKRYGYVEQLNEQVFSQVLHSCLLTFNKFKHFYFKPCDVILVLFYNPHDIERIHKHKWSAKLPSPVSFRNFYDSVMYEEMDRLSEEKQPYDELHSSLDQVVTSRSTNINKDLGNMLFSVCKDEFLLEDSIKYYESIHLQKTLDINDIKPMKENLSKHNILNKEIEQNFGKPDTEASISSTGKITKEISNNKIIREWNATDIHVKPSISSEDCEESFLEGYDLGSERVEIFGEDTKFISSNGKMMVSVKSLLQHGRQKIISIEIEQDKNSMFYHVESTNESKVVSCNNKEKVMTFHLILRNGVIIAFENTVDIHGNSCIIKKQKESKESINKEEEIETIKVEGMMEMHKHSKPTFDKCLKSSMSKDPSNNCDNGLERKSERKTDDLKCLHVCGFDMTLSLPNGLTVEKKVSNGSPFYVKQKYVSKGRHSVTNEEFRLYLSNGNILKFMINGEVIILCPNSTVYVCKKFKICEQSTEKDNTDNLEDEIKISNKISADHYTILLPSGKSYEKICGNFHDQPSLALRYATDMEDQKVYIRRGDGTCSILQSEGHLIVNFPDKSCISTFLNVLEEDFLSDIVWEEGDLSTYFSDSDTSQNCDNSKEKSSQIIIGKPVVEESYVVIYLNHHFEHPYFSSVYFDGLHESARITIPQDTVINITKDGKHHLSVHNSIELEIMDSHAKFIYGNAESTLYFQNESDNKELLCTNNDGLGNMFNIKYDGTTNICRSVGRDSVEEEEHCKMRLLVVKRDNSGAEFHERRDIDSYLAEAKSNAKVSVMKHLECDVTEEQQSHFFTIFSPLTEFEKNNWLMPVENSVDAIQYASSNVVRSTYWVDNEGKPASFWFNPFPKSKKRNLGYQRKQQWDESMGDVLCFRVLRQLSSPGVSHGRFSLANIMHKAFQKYKHDTDRIHIQEIDGSKIQNKYFSEDDPENPKMESKILKEKKWLENSKSLVWNTNVEASFIEGLINKANKITRVKHNLVRNEEKRLKKLQRLREAAKKEQEDWMKLRNKVILPYHTLY